MNRDEDFGQVALQLVGPSHPFFEGVAHLVHLGHHLVVLHAQLVEPRRDAPHHVAVELVLVQAGVPVVEQGRALALRELAVAVVEAPHVARLVWGRGRRLVGRAHVVGTDVGAGGRMVGGGLGTGVGSDDLFLVHDYDHGVGRHFLCVGNGGLRLGPWAPFAEKAGKEVAQPVEERGHGFRVEQGGLKFKV